MIKRSRQIRRIYYPAGLISLVCLPILCIWYFYSYHAFDKLSAMQIVGWSKDWNELSPYHRNMPPDRNYVTINLSGSDKENGIKLDSARLKIRQLVSANDTLNGIRIHFENNSKYWTLVRAFDICKIENAQSYVLIDNDFWICHFAPRPVSQRVAQYGNMCGTSSMTNNAIPLKSEFEIVQERKEKISYLIQTTKAFSVSGALLILMTLLAIKETHRKLKTP